MSFYPKYKSARNAAWRVLIENQITAFPVDLNALIKRYGIRLMSYQRNRSEVQMLLLDTSADGHAVRIGKQYYIFYDADAYLPRLRFTIAHELGHILLGHIKERRRKQSRFRESQANVFASRLLMPAIIARHKSLITPAQLSAAFGVSLTAATIRAERLALLRRRGKWLTSRLERRYYELYKSVHSNAQF